VYKITHSPFTDEVGAVHSCLTTQSVCPKRTTENLSVRYTGS